jgi:hypothetical protein
MSAHDGGFVASAEFCTFTTRAGDRHTSRDVLDGGLGELGLRRPSELVEGDRSAVSGLVTPEARPFERAGTPFRSSIIVGASRSASSIARASRERASVPSRVHACAAIRLSFSARSASRITFGRLLGAL